MGNGSDPTPLNDLGRPIVIDVGTSARTNAPTPGPVGLDSSSGSPNKTQPSIAQQIVGFARQRLGQRHGDGECFTLVDDALRHAGAKSAADYGKVTPDADYVWGTSVRLSDVKSGDVIQFRDYRYDRTIETKNADGSSSTDTDFQERPHHTAIVEQVLGDGSITVLEQNSPDGDPVARNTLSFKSRTTTSGNTTTTIEVSGTFHVYRPEKR